jgi:hypothetical protein
MDLWLAAFVLQLLFVFAVQGSNMFDNKLNYILYYGTHEKIELKI